MTKIFFLQVMIIDREESIFFYFTLVLVRLVLSGNGEGSMGSEQRMAKGRWNGCGFSGAELAISRL